MCKTPNFSLGSIVYVRYRDHVLFRNVTPDIWRPFIREAIGWLDYEDSECIRLVWERFAEPREDEEARQRSTGIVILRSTILKMREVV